MSLKYTYSSPKLHDKEIQTLQTLFEAYAWVEDAYPLVRKGEDDKGNGFPLVYANDGSDTSYKILPDSEISCFCFFELEGEVTRFEESMGKYSYPLSVTFWLQLDKVYPAKAYDYTSELIVAVMNTLDDQGCTDISYTTDPDDIFEGFSELQEKTTQHFMRNYSAFKITFSKEGTQCS